MLLQRVGDHVRIFCEHCLATYPQTVFYSSLLFILWLSWMAWRFIVEPWCYPNQPREYPYFIPVVGHTISFFENSDALVRKAFQYFGSASEPFAITIAGSRIYVIADPKYVSVVYGNSTSFSFEVFVEQLLKSFDLSTGAVKAFFERPTTTPGSVKFPNPSLKPLSLLARDIHMHQLYPGPELDKLEELIVQIFRQQLSKDSLEHGEIPLLKWSSDIFVSTGQDAYFGQGLTKVCPGFVQDFFEFDELSWQVLFQYPRILTRRINQIKERLFSGMSRYLELNGDERRADAAWFVNAIEEELRGVGFEGRDLVGIFIIIYWGINTNTRRICFWMLSFIVQNPELCDRIRAETSTAFGDAEDSIDLQHIRNDCPQLSAIFDESLRMSAFSASVRYIEEDTLIAGKVVRKGERLMIPFRLLHFNKNIFGDDASSFVADRFLNKKNLNRTTGWQPFGGGQSLCPGRYVAKRTTLYFVAMLLHKFDIEAVPGQLPPQVDTCRPVQGIANRKGDGDYMIRLSKRK